MSVTGATASWVPLVLYALLPVGVRVLLVSLCHSSPGCAGVSGDALARCVFATSVTGVAGVSCATLLMPQVVWVPQ